MITGTKTAIVSTSDLATREIQPVIFDEAQNRMRVIRDYHPADIAHVASDHAINWDGCVELVDGDWHGPVFRGRRTDNWTHVARINGTRWGQPASIYCLVAVDP